MRPPPYFYHFQSNIIYNVRMILPSTRSEARALGLSQYQPKRRCPHAHNGPYYVSTGGCVRCSAERHAKLKRERDEARGPDPISTLTSEERAYISGLVDGDGCIYVAAVGPLKKTVYPSVCVVVTYRPVIDWLCDRLSSGTVKMQKGRHKPQYRFQVFGKRARLLCEAMLPYLKIKHKQAKLVMAFPGDQYHGPANTIPDDINVERYRLRDTINALNH